MKLNARQLRDLEHPTEPPKIKRIPMYLILDNVYDTYNIGGLFRLADALSMEKIYLCGATETPPNHKIKKASIGTYKIVPWEYKKTTIEAVQELRNIKFPAWVAEPGDPKRSFQRGLGRGGEDRTHAISILAVEQHQNSIPYTDLDYTLPLALIVGNETTGVSPEVLSHVDYIVEIPMLGINKSLNVIVSAAIVGYEILRRINVKEKRLTPSPA